MNSNSKKGPGMTLGLLSRRVFELLVTVNGFLLERSFTHTHYHIVRRRMYLNHPCLFETDRTPSYGFNNVPSLPSNPSYLFQYFYLGYQHREGL